MNDKNILTLVPKFESFFEYMYPVLDKLPRVEKFNIGNDFKNVMYSMFKNIMYLVKVENYEKKKFCSYIDADINIIRSYIRIMYKLRYINERKYLYVVSLIDEIGKILGGYIKFLRCNNG